MRIYRIILPIVLLGFFVGGHCSIVFSQEKVALIFDTDMGPDYDDVGAIAMLHTLADMGEVNVLATMSCNHHYLSGPTIDFFNRYFRRPDIPVGVPRGLAVSMTAPQKWPQLVLGKYTNKHQSNDEYPDALTLYRQILAKASDSSVVIVSVGFFTNLSDLLNSKEDKVSALTGRQLIEKKVKKLISMAGRFPEGREFNIYKDTVSAINVIENWPTDIVFSGWEIGNEIRTGLSLVNDSTFKESPVKDVYAHSIPLAQMDSLGRMSWDQTAVLVAVKGHNPYFNIERGEISLLENGKNTWTRSNTGKHGRLIKKMDSSEVAAIIEKLMCR